MCVVRLGGGGGGWSEIRKQPIKLDLLQYIPSTCNIIKMTSNGQKNSRVPKVVARLLATTALRVRIQTSLKNTKWATKA
jgi:hypothetical protein